ncbi:MAG: rhodanese-like domain-containing protein [Fusobacteriaceae bacterium]
MKEFSMNKEEALEFILDEEAVIIDCRNPEELEQMSPIVPEVYNIPWDKDFMEQVEDEEIDKDSKILVYCSHGIRSLKAVQSLRDSGYNNSYSLTGGIVEVYKSPPSDKVGKFYE